MSEAMGGEVLAARSRDPSASVCGGGSAGERRELAGDACFVVQGSTRCTPWLPILVLYFERLVHPVQHYPSREGRPDCHIARHP